VSSNLTLSAIKTKVLGGAVAFYIRPCW
jgi:hypothetical protein